MGSVVRTLSPRQDSPSHFEPYPTIRGTEGEHDRKMPTGPQDGIRNRRTAPVLRMRPETLQQRFAANSTGLGRPATLASCHSVLKATAAAIGLVTLRAIMNGQTAYRAGYERREWTRSDRENRRFNGDWKAW